MVDSKILLIEDHPPSQAAYGQLLAGWGYEPTIVGSCAEARAVFKPNHFACSLIDLGLPDGRGSDLLSEFSRQDPLLVNVVLTGDGSAETILKTMREGVFDYLRKPLNAGIFKQAVNRALTHHEALRQRAALNQLLLEERQQLKIKVEEATKDLRLFAVATEASNARLSALVRLTQAASSGLQSVEDLFQGVLEEMAFFIPVHCIALEEGPQGEFIAAYRPKKAPIALIKASANTTAMEEAPLAKTDPEESLWAAVARHTDIQPETFTTYAFAQGSGNRPSSMVGMLLAADYQINASEQEFLDMCAHHVAAEWKMSQLLHHAAHYTSLGSIALELSRTFVKSLTAIQLSADVLGEMLGDSEEKDYLTVIPHNVSLLRKQIREFQSIAHLRKDSIETVRLDSLIEQALIILTGAVQNRSVEIVREFNVESRCILLNGTALQRTFLELLTVALQGLAHGGRIILRLSDEGKDFIRFSIIPDSTKSTTDSGLYPHEPLLFSELQRRPEFLLAQRAIHGCAGRIVMEYDREGQEFLSIILPRDATRRGIIESRPS